MQLVRHRLHRRRILMRCVAVRDVTERGGGEWDWSLGESRPAALPTSVAATREAHRAAVVMPTQSDVEQV